MTDTQKKNAKYLSTGIKDLMISFPDREIVDDDPGGIFIWRRKVASRETHRHHRRYGRH